MTSPILYMTILILCLHDLVRCLSPKNRLLEIQGSGMEEVRKGDIAIVLFVNVSNLNTKPVHAVISVKQCCVYIKYAGADCKVMKVIGGYDGDIGPAEKQRIQFIYPSMYPYELQGGCELQISNGRWIVQHHTIMFNASLPAQRTYGWLIDSVIGILFGSTIHKCSSADEDELRYCEPVNCILKYHGLRNFFDKVSRRCVVVPNCTTSTPSLHDLPVKAYDTVNNRCKELTIQLSEKDIKMMTNTHQKKELEVVDWRRMRRVNCHYGYRKSDGSGCNCEPGWVSVPLNFQKIDPKKSVYHMCNVKETGSYWVANIYILLLAVTSISVILLLVAVVIHIRKKLDFRLPCHYNKTEPRSKKNSKHFNFLHNLQMKMASQDETGISEEDYNVGSISTHLVVPHQINN